VAPEGAAAAAAAAAAQRKGELEALEERVRAELQEAMAGEESESEGSLWEAEEAEAEVVEKPAVHAPVEVPDEEMTTYEDDQRKANDERVLQQLQQVVDETNERNRQRAVLNNPAYTFVIPDTAMDQVENAMPSITRIEGLSTLYDETTTA